jgi:6-phosphogluconolactonase (cycloisomerase 2 family)
MKITRSFALALCAALFMWTGCGDFWDTVNPSPTGKVPKFAYAANFNGGGAGSVSAYTINTSSGALSAIGSPFAAGTGTVAAGADSAGKFVYAANQDKTVNAYTINRADGSLVTVNSYATGTTPVWVAVDPGGRFVYVVNGGSNDISGFAINTSTGALTAVSGPAIAVTATPLRATVDPSGRFLYVALGTGGTEIFKINSDGTLTVVRTVPAAPCAASDAVALDDSSRFVFVADGSTGICNYAVNASTGDLTLITLAVIPAGANPVAVATGGKGKFLFAANKGSSNLSGFLINVDGTLTAMPSPFSVGSAPVDVTVDPSGVFVYVANSSGISVFSINSSNSLTSVGTATAGTNPSSVVTTQ